MKTSCTTRTLKISVIYEWPQITMQSLSVSINSLFMQTTDESLVYWAKLSPSSKQQSYKPVNYPSIKTIHPYTKEPSHTASKHKPMDTQQTKEANIYIINNMSILCTKHFIKQIQQQQQLPFNWKESEVKHCKSNQDKGEETQKLHHEHFVLFINCHSIHKHGSSRNLNPTFEMQKNKAEEEVQMNIATKHCLLHSFRNIIPVLMMVRIGCLLLCMLSLWCMEYHHHDCIPLGEERENEVPMERDWILSSSL